MALYLISCVGVEHDLPYLEHFLRYYKGLGIAPGNFRVILQTTDPDSPNLAKARDILIRHGVPGDLHWSAPYSSRTMWEERRRVQAEVAGPSDWVVSADVDERHEYPAPLSEIVAWCEREGYDVIQGPFVDRLAAGGGLAKVPPPDGALDETFPVQTELRHHIGGHTRNVNLGGSVNLMLIRGNVLPGIGGHSPHTKLKSSKFALGGPLWQFKKLADARFLFTMPFLVHHYKWTDGLVERMRERLEHQEMSQAAREYTEKVVTFFDGPDALRMERLATRDPARDRPVDWQAKVRDMRRRYALMRPMIDAKRAFRKVVRIGRKAIGK